MVAGLCFAAGNLFAALTASAADRSHYGKDTGSPMIEKPTLGV
jgi:hypothetical protein